MSVYNNERDLNDTMWENQIVKDKYFEAIKKHDYSHMYSDDDRAWRAGNQSEKLIKDYLHALVSVHREDAEQLLEDSLYEVKEQYTDGLTHKVIRGWFTDYVENVYNININPYTKQAFREMNGMYYVRDKFDVDGDGWVTEEQLELLLFEFHNGVK